MWEAREWASSNGDYTQINKSIEVKCKDDHTWFRERVALEHESLVGLILNFIILAKCIQTFMNGRSECK